MYNLEGEDLPTVMILYGFRFFFYSREETRMHIHVEIGDRELKIWLDTFEVAYNHGYPNHEVLRIIKLVIKYEKTIKKAWVSHFG